MAHFPLSECNLCSYRNFYFHCFADQIRLDVSSESSARQRIHIKYQAVFSLKDNFLVKKLKCRLLQFLFGALRVKINNLQNAFLWYPNPDHVMSGSLMRLE